MELVVGVPRLECWGGRSRLVRRAGLGRRGAGVAQDVRQRLDGAAFPVSHGVAESLWARIRAVEKTAGVVVGVC